MRAYSNTDREADAYALPDVEVFYHNGTRDTPGDCWADSDGEPMPSGWYYWFCFPGCMPDSDPFGPFLSEQAALDDCREQAGDDIV
jgi:hypothetical protein